MLCRLTSGSKEVRAARHILLVPATPASTRAHASESGRADVQYLCPFFGRAQFLVDKGADVNAKTTQGFTPVDIALGKAVVIQLPVPHDSTVALLRKLGGREGT